uniref:S-adenosylmethionine decarboxylase n=1 Tax=viral metagenome TaxID=1070528 RepID=A0A6C0EHC3_9ZZZZ
MSVGKHIILDLYDVNNEILQSINTSTLYIFNDFIDHILKTANIHLLSKNIHFFDFNHENKKIDGAFTALYLLSESHLSIHTWPEKRYIAIDIFTCGNCNVEYIAQRFIDYFEPKNKKLTLLERGKYPK